MFLHHDTMIKLFSAGVGDCILVEFVEEDYRILIDGGCAETYRNYLKEYLTELVIQGKRINLLIVTHIDSDHIGGIQAVHNKVKSDGRNDISISQGNTVAGLLKERGYNWNSM